MCSLTNIMPNFGTHVTTRRVIIIITTLLLLLEEPISATTEEDIYDEKDTPVLLINIRLYLFATLGLVFGFLQLAFGYHQFGLTLFLNSFVAGNIVGFSIIALGASDYSSSSPLALVIGNATGVVFSLFFAHISTSSGIFNTGFTFGSLAVYTGLYALESVAFEPNAPRIIGIWIAGIFAGLVTLYYERPALIVTMSWIGSFAFLVGLYLLFTTTSTLAVELPGKATHDDATYGFGIGVMYFLTVGAVGVQWYFSAKDCHYNVLRWNVQNQPQSRYVEHDLVIGHEEGDARDAIPSFCFGTRFSSQQHRDRSPGRSSSKSRS